MQGIMSGLEPTSQRNEEEVLKRMLKAISNITIFINHFMRNRKMRPIVVYIYR